MLDCAVLQSDRLIPSRNGNVRNLYLRCTPGITSYEFEICENEIAFQQAYPYIDKHLGHEKTIETDSNVVQTHPRVLLIH